MPDESHQTPKIVAVVKRDAAGNFALCKGAKVEPGDVVTLFPESIGMVAIIGEVGTNERADVENLLRASRRRTPGFLMHGSSAPRLLEETPENSLVYLYLDQMEEVKKRLNLAEGILVEAQRQDPSLSHFELMGLHIRKILELIAFASLAAHKEKYAEVYQEFQEHWNAKRLLSNLHKINADFYPKPIELVRDDPTDLIFVEVTEGYLTQDEFIELYGYASEAIHVQNPFRPARFESRYSFSGWLDRIVGLLRLHQIRLVETSRSWIVQLASSEHSEASIIGVVSDEE